MTNKILVIDTETGGLDSSEHSLLSIAGVALDIKNSTVHEIFNILVREPYLCVQKEAMEVNKINLNEIIQNGISPTQAVEEIVNSINKEFPFGKPVVLGGHNVSFDVSFLKRLFRLASHSYNIKQIFSHRTVDTASIVQFLQMSESADKERSPNLDFLLQIARVPYEKILDILLLEMLN